MIKLNENPIKRFNIERNYINHLNKQKHNNTNKSDINLMSDYSLDIENAKKKLIDIKNQLAWNINNQPNNKDEILLLDKKINSLKTYINNLEKLKKRSLNTTSVKIQNIKYSAKTIRMGAFYKIKSLKNKLILSALIGAISSIIVWLFVQYTGVYSPGISGIIQGFAKIIKIVMLNANCNETSISLVYNILFWFLYFLINIPLIIFAYYKISKQFAILTIIYIAFSQLIGFGLGFINNGNGIFIFTNMNQIDTNQSSLFIQGVQLVPWNSSNGIIPGIFTYGLIYGIISGTSYSIIYILGGSTGGTDVLGFYYSKIKNKSIGTILTYFNIGSLILGVTLGSFACWMLNANSTQKSADAVLEALFSPNLIVSIVASGLSGLIYNYFFPKNKVIKVQIYSSKIEELALYLVEKEWNYKINIQQSNTHSFSNGISNKSLETVCAYIDLPSLISNIRDVDETGLITIYSIFGVDGELPTKTYEK